MCLCIIMSCYGVKRNLNRACWIGPNSFIFIIQKYWDKRHCLFVVEIVAITISIWSLGSTWSTLYIYIYICVCVCVNSSICYIFSICVFFECSVFILLIVCLNCRSFPFLDIVCFGPHCYAVFFAVGDWSSFVSLLRFIKSTLNNRMELSR